MLKGRYEPEDDDPVAGGHGTVAIYRDTFLNRKVAVKALHPSADQKRLLDEIQALGIVHSSNVVAVYDVDVDRTSHGNQILLIQEFVEGNDLTHFIGEHVTLLEALNLLYQLAKGLADVHAAGITHRDVKPSNVRVDAQGVVKLLDFGLARQTDRQHTVGAVGTPGFMATELRLQGHVAFTQAVDTFAFAVTAACVLHEQQDPAETPEDRGVDFTSDNISEKLKEALTNALSSNPDRRPAMAVIRDLFKRELTHNKHRAVIVTETAIEQLTVERPTVTLSAGALGSCSVAYDGYEFQLHRESGSVYVNNVAVIGERELSGSTLITLGSPSAGWNRSFIRFDVSHPEVAPGLTE